VASLPLLPSHRIHRIEVEVEVGPVAHGHAVIERLSLLHPRRIAPLIDRVCSELSGPERHDRIDTLELELGTIALDEFDDDFMLELEVALRSALARQLDGPTRERPETAVFELLESFARTGNLPWWADREREDLIAEQIGIAIDAAPERWLGLLRTLAEDPMALARLATHCHAAQIEAIAQRAGLTLVSMTQLRELERWSIETGVFASKRVAELRVRSAWLAVLGRSGLGRGVRPHELVGELIGLAPIVLGPLRRAIEASVAQEPDGPTADWTPEWLLSAAASVLTGVEPMREREDAVANGRNAATPASASRENRESEDPESEDPESEDPESEDPESENRESEDPESANPESANPKSENPESENHESENRESEDPESENHESEDPESANPESENHEDPDLARDPATPRPRQDHPPPRPEESLEPAQSPRLPPSVRRAERRRALDRLETLYVDDAGLVILWPFLDRFFLRAGLLDLDRRFVDEQATMQAIALLSQLAVEDADPPEFRLPLAKLLCGRSPEDAFVLERPLAFEQIDECDQLLGSVIHNAPILRDTTIASFRANFIRRPAALSIRDGAWLLEVEERPHDLVLQRFPWSWSWVKLAWMADPLLVRW
jgi:hypothetical protein